MDKQFILSLIQSGESQTCEFKTEEVAKDITSLIKTICSFSNTSGGSILVGVSDSLEILGVSQSEDLIGKIILTLPHAIIPEVQVTLTDVDLDGVHVIMINVPVGADVPYVFDDKIFIRRFQNDVIASAEDIRRMISGRLLTNERWERRILFSKNVKDLDPKTLLQFKNESDVNLYNTLQNIKRDEALLALLGLGVNSSIFNSAFVLFGEKPERVFPQMRLSIAVYNGVNKDKLTERKSIDGNLFQIIEQAMAFLEKNIRISSHLSEKSIKRKMIPAYPKLAIREALLNAIVHRDYESPDGGVSISLFEDRIEFWNSGTLPSGIKLADLKVGHSSRPRNPDIANVFLLTGYIELVGSGTNRILSQFKNSNLPEPKWSELSNGVLLTFRSQAKRALKNNVEKYIFNERQLSLLKTLPLGESISVAEYLSSLSGEIQERQARDDVKNLVEYGYLNKVGIAKSTRYVRTSKE